MWRIFNYDYLSKRHIKGLASYKYSAIDNSPLSNYLMHPLWSFSVKVIPRWVAPNVLTFLGFILVAGFALLLTVFDYGFYGPSPTGREPVPSLVFTVCGLFLFIAYNLDGMDGKQARRLGVSGPLGELFDHGIDSTVVFFIPYAFIAVFGRDHEFTLSMIRGLLLVISVCLNFYVSHWEKYSTGTLYLPWGYDVSMWVSSLLFLLPGLYGPAVYHKYLYEGVTMVQALEVVVHSTGLFTTLPVSIYNVYLVRKSRKSLQKSLLQALRPVWSMTAMNGAIIYWALYSPTNVLEYDLNAFVMLYGAQFSHISCRLIVAEICKHRCDVMPWMCWTLLAGVAVSLSQPALEVPILYGLLFLSLAGHVHYAVCVVRQLCSHYRICCFKVPESKKK